MVRAWVVLLVWLIAAAGLSGFARSWTTDNRLDKWVGQIADETVTALRVAEAWGYVNPQQTNEVLQLSDRLLAMIWRLTHPRN